jgi:hypothetical protein
MTECTWLSDRMPSVALGRTEWTADEIQHLSGCSACRLEWELLQATSRLGDRAAAELDAPSITRALQNRLGRSTERQRKRKAWGFAGLAAAAALAGVLWSGRGDSPLHAPSAPVVAGLQIPLPELEELQPAELDSVLRGMDLPAPDIDTLEATDSGPEDAPLETIYDYWEG